MSHLEGQVPDCEVVVGGGRCAGAATAMILARLGHRVAVLERSRALGDTLSTHGLARGGVVQLSRRGLLEPLLDTGAPAVTKVAFIDASGTVRRPLRRSAGVDVLVAPRRHVLDRLLLDAAVDAGAVPMLGTEVTAPVRHGGRVRGIHGRGPITADVLRYSAFTDGGRGGNPAGVVLDASGLDESQMLQIAAAVGYSETAFVFPAETGARRVRYLAPRIEVAFCGHATIATAVAIAEREGAGPLELSTLAGPVSVTTVDAGGELAATLTSPPTSTSTVEPKPLRQALGALRWASRDLHPGFPPQVAFAGVHHLVLAAATAGRLSDLDYDFEALGAVMASAGWTTVCLFRPDETDGVYHVRNPFPPGGVVEDPATGAAAAALGGYLRDLGLVSPPARLTLLQGHDMGSPSRLLVDVDPGTRSIRVTGTATPLAPPP